MTHYSWGKNTCLCAKIAHVLIGYVACSFRHRTRWILLIQQYRFCLKVSRLNWILLNRTVVLVETHCVCKQTFLTNSICMKIVSPQRAYWYADIESNWKIISKTLLFKLTVGLNKMYFFHKDLLAVVIRILKIAAYIFSVCTCSSLHGFVE